MFALKPSTPSYVCHPSLPENHSRQLSQIHLLCRQDPPCQVMAPGGIVAVHFCRVAFVGWSTKPNFFASGDFRCARDYRYHAVTSLYFLASIVVLFLMCPHRIVHLLSQHT